MKLKLSYLLLICLLTLSTKEVCALVVVVNKESDVNQLTKTQVIDIFMGRYSTFPDGIPVKPLDLPANSNIKRDFYKKLVGKDLAKIDAYWARLLFSGRASPPSTVSNLEELMQVVTSNHGSLAYLPESKVTDSVKVVLRLD